MTLELDRVSCAGQMRLDPFRYVELPFAKDALRLITEEEFFRGHLLTTRPRVANYSVEVPPCYRHRHGILQEDGLMEESSRHEVLFISGYFEVEKKGRNGAPSTARAIFNGKALSALFETPGTVNLPEIPEMLNLAKEMLRCRSARPSVITADIRHMFHH